MNNFARKLLMQRMDKRRRRDMADREDMTKRKGSLSWDNTEDSRRGVKGSGRGGRRSSRRDMNDMEDMEDMYDMEDMEDELDGHDIYRLERQHMKRWKHNLRNTDGTTGPHFEMSKILSAADRMGLQFEDYDEAELCMTANMLYSDFGETLKSLIPPDKEHMVYVKLAQDFLEDPDASAKGSEKLLIYYCGIVERD